MERHAEGPGTHETVRALIDQRGAQTANGRQDETVMTRRMAKILAVTMALGFLTGASAYFSGRLESQ